MSKSIDDLIDECARLFGTEARIYRPDTKGEHRAAEKQFFFGSNIQTPNRNGECPDCRQVMRIHLSTYICDLCESRLKK